MKKKWMVWIAVMMMVLSATTAVFAQQAGEGAEPVDRTQISMEKVYELLHSGNGSVAPADAFSFTIKEKGVTDSGAQIVPKFAKPSYTVSVDGAGKKAAQIDLPQYDAVGVYEYEIAEVSGDTAGVEYDKKSISLKVYVYNRPDKKGLYRTYAFTDDAGKKVDGFKNIYQAGKLDVSKTVTGLLGDTKKAFEVEVRFTKPEGKTVKGEIHYGDHKKISADALNDGSETVTVKIRDGETVSFTNIPYGCKYEVAEKNYQSEGYETSYRNEKGRIGAPAVAAEITNSKGGKIPTGLAYDVMKYAGALLVVVILGCIVVVRRRKQNAQ